jgi:predicted esterase
MTPPENSARHSYCARDGHLARTARRPHQDAAVRPQGERDPRVNKAESDQMVEALKKRGVDVQYMVKDNEGHSFSNEENQFEFYEAMDKFFTQHLKP